MAKRKTTGQKIQLSEKAQRKNICTSLRSIARRLGGMRHAIREREDHFDFPRNPYEGLLVDIEAYFDKLADQFQDWPGSLPGSTLAEARAEVCTLREQAISAMRVGTPTEAERADMRAEVKQALGEPPALLRGRNRGPNGDTVEDLYSDALRMLKDGHAADALRVLEEIEIVSAPKPDMAEGVDASRDLEDLISTAIDLLEQGNAKEALEELKGEV
jgi:hypothetical protein